jgi:hypothetical protein
LSAAASDPGTTGPAAAATEPSLFQHEVRRDGRVVATLRAYAAAGGFTVESEVFPLTQPVGGDPVTRPFPFTTLEQAHRFVDDALVAFEYLNCTIS